MHILIFITCQISSFRLLRLNIKLFWKSSPKNYDLSFNVHLRTRQRINISDDIACVAGILTRSEFTQSPTPVFVLHSMRNRRDKKWIE